jgi:hypothetical protein
MKCGNMRIMGQLSDRVIGRYGDGEKKVIFSGSPGLRFSASFVFRWHSYRAHLFEYE